MYFIFRHFLFLFEPEFSHHLVMKGLKTANFLGLLYFIPNPSRIKPKTIMGLKFTNLIGLAAGLDKNAEYIDCLAKLGFGFIEVGTVTPRPQPGNPKPRLFRLTPEEGIINRFGFNNIGIHQVLKNIKKSKYKGILGINIGKNVDTPIQYAVDDYLICFREAYQFVSYITINVSSPNTKNLRKLQEENFLEDLLSKIKQEQNILSKIHKKYVPFVLKISPDNSHVQLDCICKLLIKYEIDGVIATNTSISRKEVKESFYAKEMGGLSGRPLKEKSSITIKYLSKKLQGRVPIIGVGGILSIEDGIEKIDNGAELIQIYSGLIFKGYRLVHELCSAVK